MSFTHRTITFRWVVNMAQIRWIILSARTHFTWRHCNLFMWLRKNQWTPNALWIYRIVGITTDNLMSWLDVWRTKILCALYLHCIALWSTFVNVAAVRSWPEGCRIISVSSLIYFDIGWWSSYGRRS